MIGALAVFALFCAILFRGMRIAHEEPDPFASLLAVGLTAMLSLAGVGQYGGGDRTGADQGTAAAVSQLRRHFDGDGDGGARGAARALAASGSAMKTIIAGGGTGGHLFPAVALGEELKRERPDADVLHVGTANGLEATWLPQSGLNYELFPVHGLRGKDPLSRLRALGEFFAAVRPRAARCSKFWRRPGGQRRRLRLRADGGGGDNLARPAGPDGAEHPPGTRQPDALALRAQNLRRLCRDRRRFSSRREVEVTGNPVRFSVHSWTPAKNLGPTSNPCFRWVERRTSA